MARSAASAHHNRELTKKRSREKLDSIADIGEIPPCQNPERRESCERDLHEFLRTYFPQSTGLSPFSEDHKRAIGRIQRCVLEGGLFVQAFPRGFAKTTISENSVVWAILYGHRRFIPIFGADASAAAGNIDAIKLELAENDLLYEDFPEVCHAIRALEGKPQRCASQTHEGRQTHIEWRADTIVIPTIEGSRASSAIITASGIEGASRGMKHRCPDGTQQRPDFVVIDDPQTDKSAATPLQVSKRLDVIRKSILKLGGHDRRIAVVMNATVIRPDDIVEQLLDPKRFPAWQGERIKMVKAWSKAHETLWMGDYTRIRNGYQADVLGDQQRAHRAATEFYELNRAKMDEACVVSWSECYDRDTELSAIQHAYNALIDDGPEVFASECQNEPLRDDGGVDELRIIAKDVCGKLNRLDRHRIPSSASRLLFFLDPKQDAIYWTGLAFEDCFTGFVIDYATFPEQRKAYYSSRDITKGRNNLKGVVGEASVEANVYGGLDRLVAQIMGREWKRDDGAILRPDKIVIDAGWGPMTETIKTFCRQSPFAASLLPSKGLYVGATGRAFADYRPKVGDRTGPGWRISATENRRDIRQLVFDTNYWKSFTAARLKTAMGGRGCLSLYGESPEQHRLFADHCAAEIPIEVEAKGGRKVVEWKQPPGQDNDYFDCIVGCHVAASVMGSALVAQVPRVVKRVRLSEMQKRAREWRSNV